MKKIIAAVTAFLLSLMGVAPPSERTPVFSAPVPITEKAPYDEGVATVTDTDLVVAVNGSDDNNGTVERPLFRDVDNADFTVANNSPALDLGFEPWNYNTAGTITRY